jgi:hypothetical protein
VSPCSANLDQSRYRSKFGHRGLRSKHSWEETAWTSHSSRSLSPARPKTGGAFSWTSLQRRCAHACKKDRGCDCPFYLRSRLRTGAKRRGRRGRTARRKGRSRSSWPAWVAGASGSSRTASLGAGESAMRVIRSNCQAATCRAECNEDEVLIVAYCGPRRSVPTFVNERTVTCPRGASPLVVACAKATQ